MADLPSGGRTAKLARDAAQRREQLARALPAAGAPRDVTARAPGAGADGLDEVAAARKRAASRRIASPMHNGSGTMSASERIVRAAGDRTRTERAHAEAAAHRGFADRDRRALAHERERAAYERLHALVYRELQADALADAEVDPLTGARMRQAGLADLDRELLCCHRTSRSLVVVHVDVVALATPADGAGHAPGDEVLARVVAQLKRHLRSYDLIIRLGGRDVLCAMTGVPLAEARRRFVAIAASLSAGPGAVAVRTGFAALAPGDTTVALTARAEGQMRGRPHPDRARRSGRRATPPRA